MMKLSTACSKCGQPFKGTDSLIGHENATWHAQCPHAPTDDGELRKQKDEYIGVDVAFTDEQILVDLHNLGFHGESLEHLEKLESYIHQYGNTRAVEERKHFKKLWLELKMQLGASAGNATGVIVENEFGEEFDFQLDRNALNDINAYMNNTALTQPQREEK